MSVHEDGRETVEPAGSQRPATFANRFYVVVQGDLTRISIGETFADGADRYHTSIIMRTSDAVGLAQTIGELVSRAQEVAGAKPTS